jgi:hypothetical protein
MQRQLDLLLRDRSPDPSGTAPASSTGTDTAGSLDAAKAKAAEAAATVELLTKKYEEEKQIAQQISLAAAAAAAAAAASSSSAGDTGDETEDTAHLLTGGGNSEAFDATALKSQLDAVLAALKAILTKGNDVCSSHMFALDECLIGLEGTDRASKVSSTLDMLSPALSDVINAKSATRTKKANAYLGRLMSYMAGNVSLQTSGAIETSSQNSAASPSPSEPRDQRQLWDEYTPFFSALFAPGKYATEGSLGRQILMRTFGGRGSYFTDQQASAILQIPKRQ